MADNLLFTYTTPFLDRGNDLRPNSLYRFATTYAQTFIEWTTQIRRPRRAGNVQIEVSCRNYRSIFPPSVSSCHFTLVKKQDKECIALAEQTIISELEDVVSPITRFSLRGQNPFTGPLMLSTSQNTVQLVICMSLPRKDFEADHWLQALPPTPLHVDWTFGPLEDQSQLDKRILCTNGEYMVSGDAVWRSAPGLRAMLDLEDIKVDYCLQTVKTVVTYALTYTFLSPPHYDSQQIRQLLDVAKLAAIQEKHQFLLAVEQSACQHIETMGLIALLDLFMTAIDNRLDKLETSIAAVILAKHYMTLQTRVMQQETELTKKMRRRTTFRASSPLTKLEDMWLKQSAVMVAERAEPK